MIRKGNVTIGLQTRFGPDWTGIRCGARTQLGGECQRPAVKKTGRCTRGRVMFPTSALTFTAT